MKKYIIIILTACAITSTAIAQEYSYKTAVDVSVDNVGTATCEYKTKYTAAYWDLFTKTIGTNTSILKNNLIRMFPKQLLSDFKYSQEADEKTNTVTFKVNGMMKLDDDGKWEADLEKKDPDITKISNTEFLLIEDGNTMKIHLPPGTTDAKVEKNSFGKAMLTYSAKQGGMMGWLMMGAGILCILGGGFLMYKNSKQNQGTPIRTIYDQQQEHKQVTPPPVPKGVENA